ncbi:MAG: hypothetical protein HY812_05175, partial [Planctomycetes bacterium]|nr:hypothetical protein [Planctomycetota bacterium]
MSPWKRLCLCTTVATLVLAGNVAAPSEVERLPVAPATLVPLDTDVTSAEPRLVLVENKGLILPDQAVLRLENPTHLPLHIVAHGREGPVVVHQRADAPLPDWSQVGGLEEYVVVSVPARMAWVFETEHGRDPVEGRCAVREAAAPGAPGRWIASPLYRHPRVGPAAPGWHPSVSFVEWKRAR